MKVCCLASGSKGNMTYVETEDLKILIDCGIAIKEAEKKLAQIKVEPKDINVILITHEHIDHIRCLSKFIEKYDPKVYIPKMCYLEISKKMKLGHRCFQLENKEFYIGKTIISPIQLNHDSIDCFGYSIICESGKFSIATDTGVLTYEAMKQIKDSDVVVIESNHNEVLLMNNPNYPLALKRRILSQRGHLSNRQCAESIRTLCKLGCSQFVLAHLSEENNTPKLAYMDIVESLISHDLVEGKDYFIDIALQNNIGTLYSINIEESELSKFLKS